MPYKSEKIIIRGSQYDRRQKLTPEQKSEIAFRYATTDISQRKLAEEYGQQTADYLYRKPRRGAKEQATA